MFYMVKNLRDFCEDKDGCEEKSKQVIGELTKEWVQLVPVPDSLLNEMRMYEVELDDDLICNQRKIYAFLSVVYRLEQNEIFQMRKKCIFKWLKWTIHNMLVNMDAENANMTILALRSGLQNPKQFYEFFEPSWENGERMTWEEYCLLENGYELSMMIFSLTKTVFMKQHDVAMLNLLAQLQECEMMMR